MGTSVVIPCRQCGGAPAVDHGAYMVTVVCADCYDGETGVPFGRTEAEALEAWAERNACGKCAGPNPRGNDEYCPECVSEEEERKREASATRGQTCGEGCAWCGACT